MKYSKMLLFDEFRRIRNLGWIKTMRSGPTGVGYTFEKLLNIPENTLPLPDYCNIEIKTHRDISTSNICLFSYDPVGSYSYEIKHIYDTYSYASVKYPSQKVFNATIYCHIKKRMPCDCKFSLQIDYNEERVFLVVHDSKNDLLEKDAYWSFSEIKKKLYDKLQYLAYISADSRYIDGVEYFYYKSIRFYKLKSFDTFIKLLDSCKISVSFRIGGRKVQDFPWQIDNHGTSFSIKSYNLHKLYTLF